MLYSVLLTAVLVSLGTSATVNKESVNVRDFDNYVCKSSDIVFSMQVFSKIQCASICAANPTCKNVFYKSGSNQCTGCNVFYTASSNLVADPGTTYYVPIDGDPACNKPARNFRLCDGTSSGVGHSYRGRIEVLYNRTWWSVCDDCWDWDCPPSENPIHNANTVCAAFGLTGDSTYTADNFGSNTKPLLIENVECSETKYTIFDCPHIGPPAIIQCGLGEAVGVSCLDN